MFGEAGKGDRERTRDREAYRRGHGRIFGKPKRLRGGHTLFVCGEWVDPNNLTAAQADAMRKNDAHNIVSICGGVNPSQAAEFNGLYADQGATACPVTGNVKFRDRPARLRNLKARGLHDLQEIRG